jgi:hypothetical protein
MANLLFIVGFVAFFGIVGWQVLQWLQFGFWPDIPVSYAFEYFQLPYPAVTWVGVQKIINVILRWPLSFVVFGVCMVLRWFFEVAEKQEKINQEIRRRNEAWDRANNRRVTPDLDKKGRQ